MTTEIVVNAANASIISLQEQLLSLQELESQLKQMKELAMTTHLTPFSNRNDLAINYSLNKVTEQLLVLANVKLDIMLSIRQVKDHLNAWRNQ